MAKKEKNAEQLNQAEGQEKTNRINLKLTPENHDFIKTVSRVSGKNMTDFMNDLIAQYRQEHPDVLQKAKAFLAELGMK